MKVHQDIDHLPAFERCVLTIGTFDGVHLGHRQIIAQLKNEAIRINGETVIITFHPHPRKVINSSKPPIHLLNTIEEKIELLEALGLDHLVIVPFDQRFSQISAEEYIEQFLVSKFLPHTIIIGYDHHFGKGRSGNYLLLEEYSSRLGFDLIEISPHIIENNTVSSTSIRRALQRGDVTTANSLLGYEYFFDGTVIEGNKLGRTLGYPTANIDIKDEEKLVPANGIYIVEAVPGDSDSLGRNKTEMQPGTSPRPGNVARLKGMMSIGIRPTLSDGRFMIEVNIFDFDENIYGKTLRVYIKNYLRPEIKFGSLVELKDQLSKDKQASLEYFAKSSQER